MGLKVAIVLVGAMLTLWALGRILALLRGPPRGQDDISYRWNHWLPRCLARFSDAPDHNWKVTFGRVTLVRQNSIEPESAAHEFYHSLDGYRRSIPIATLRCVIQYAAHGYRQAPVEFLAHAYAVAHVDAFTRRFAPGSEKARP